MPDVIQAKLNIKISIPAQQAKDGDFVYTNMFHQLSYEAPVGSVVFSTRKKAQTSVVLGWRGHGAFGLDAALARIRSIDIGISWLIQTMTSRL